MHHLRDVSNRISSDEEQLIVEMYRQGNSCHTIAIEIGRADRTVWRVLRDLEVQMRPARRRPEIELYRGKNFGRWTVVADAGSKRSIAYWLCRCQCGREKEVRSQNLISGESTGCSQCCHSKHSNITDVKSWYVSSVLGSARKRGLTVEVTQDDLWSLFEEQQGLCALSGLLLSFGERHSQRAEQTASLDRIDSARGYVIDNVQWVHKDVNKMKNSFDQEYFIEMCKKVAGNCEV